MYQHIGTQKDKYIQLTQGIQVEITPAVIAFT